MQSSQSNNATSTQNSVVPAYLQNASQQAVNQGESIATSTYSPYTGQAIAPQTGNQEQASALAAQQAQAYNAPGGLSTMATQAFNPTNVGAFVNPNTSGVVSDLGQRIQQQYNPAQVALTSGEAATGNMGSNRAYINQGALSTQKQNALSDMAASEYGNAVNSGTQAFEAERGQAANEGQTDMGALNATGAASRATEQNQLNYNYNQFLTQRDWQANHLAPLLSALGSSRNDVEQTGTGEGIQYQSSLGSMIGSGAALAGGGIQAGEGLSNYLEGYTTSPGGALNENYLGSDNPNDMSTNTGALMSNDSDDSLVDLSDFSGGDLSGG
jgi:hypothetical protein